MLEDVNAGVGYVLRRAVLYGGDPARVFLVGQSCGAHLLSLAALTQVGGVRACVRVSVSVCMTVMVGVKGTAHGWHKPAVAGGMGGYFLPSSPAPGGPVAAAPALWGAPPGQRLGPTCLLPAAPVQAEQHAGGSVLPGGLPAWDVGAVRGMACVSGVYNVHDLEDYLHRQGGVNRSVALKNAQLDVA